MMKDFIENFRQLLAGYNAIQRLGIYVVFSTSCSLCLLSYSPAVWFVIAMTLSWILVQVVQHLPYHIPEKYIFKFLDMIDYVEDIIKRFITKSTTAVTKHKSVRATGASNNSLRDSRFCEDFFRAPENEARVCIQYIVRDFINSWYKEYISSENEPIEESQEILEQLTIQTFDRLKKIDIIPFVKLVITRFQKHVSDYLQAQEHWKQQPYFRSKRSKNKPEFKKIKGLVPAFQSMGYFHPAMASETTEMEYLRSTMKIILKTSFPNEAYECQAARELLLEILTQNILKSIVDLISKPFWLHKIMVLILTDVVPEIIDGANENIEDDMTYEESAAQTPSNKKPETPVLNEPIQNLCDSNDTPIGSENRAEESNEQITGIIEIDQAEVLEDGMESSNDTKNIVRSDPEIEQDELNPTNDFRPKFFVGDIDDTSSLHSVGSDIDESLGRQAPDGCSPPKDYTSAFSAQLPQPLKTFQDIRKDNSSPTDELQSATSTDDYSDCDRKEIYQVRNKKWNPDEDRIVPSPLTLLSDASTYQEIVDITNVDPRVNTIHSAPGFSALKIDYGPDLSHIDPASLIKETPRILFAGVHIPETETAKEPGTAGYYTLYCIEYVAWHFLPSVGRWTQQPGGVKRRYREFTTLQDRLQDHPVYKKSIKNIKGPNRWRVKPLGQLHEKTVETRRRFLEQYLQTLSKKEDVGTSFALKEFLAYEADTRIAFVKKAPEMPRFDKMIVKTFSGVMNKISTMPGAIYEADRPTSPEPAENPVNEFAALVDGDSLTFEDVDKFNIEYDLWYPEEQDEAYNNIESIIWKTTYLADSKAAHLASECENVSADSEFYDPVDFTPITSPRPEGDGCDKDQLDLNGGPSDADIPLTVQILDLAVQLAEGQEAWVCHKNALHVFKIIIGRALDSFITRELGELTSSSTCAMYIGKLRDTLWPDGELDLTEEQAPSEKQKAHTRAQARQALYDFLPGALPIIVGHSDFNHCVDIVMQCIDHPELNRTFGFTLVDVIVEAVFPEIKMASLQQQLLSYSQEVAAH